MCAKFLSILIITLLSFSISNTLYAQDGEENYGNQGGGDVFIMPYYYPDCQGGGVGLSFVWPDGTTLTTDPNGNYDPANGEGFCSGPSCGTASPNNAPPQAPPDPQPPAIPPPPPPPPSDPCAANPAACGAGGSVNSGGGGPNPPPQVPCGMQVTLNGLAASFTPGSVVNLHANISPSGPVTNVTYDFQAFFGNKWWDLYPDNNAPETPNLPDFAYTMKVLGTINFQVIVTYLCNGVQQTITSSSVPTYSKFCLGNLLAQFSGDMTNAWNSTVNATATGPDKYEFGFYATFNGGNIAVNNGFSTTGFNNDVPCSNLTNETIGTYSIPNGANPNQGAIWTVGKFHTHPPLTHCAVSQYRDPGPSAPDLADVNDFPCVVRDYTVRDIGGQPPIVNGQLTVLPTRDYPYSKDCTDYR